MHSKHVIIQACGKGSRLGKYTLNKPKALLSMNGSPLILNTMKTFPGASFIVTGDYKFDGSEKLSSCFCQRKICVDQSNWSRYVRGFERSARLYSRRGAFLTDLV